MTTPPTVARHLEGSVAIIAGASRGIGAAVARALADAAAGVPGDVEALDHRRSGREHHLGRDVLGRLGHEGLAGVRQRVDRTDLRLDRAVLDEAGDLPQLGTARITDEVHGADVVPIRCRRGHDGDQGTVRPKVDAVYSLADAREAFMAKSTQPIPGKVVLTP